MDITPTVPSVPFVRTMKEVVRLYFEPLRWVRKAALRVIAEIDDGLFPGRKQPVSAEAQSGVGVTPEKEVAAQDNDGVPYYAKSALIAAELHEIALQVETLNHQLNAQNEIWSQTANRLDAKISTIAAHLELREIEPTDLALREARESMQASLVKYFYGLFRERPQSSVLHPEDVQLLIHDTVVSRSGRARVPRSIVTAEGHVIHFVEDIDELSDAFSQRSAEHIKDDARIEQSRERLENIVLRRLHESTETAKSPEAWLLVAAKKLAEQRGKTEKK